MISKGMHTFSLGEVPDLDCRITTSCHQLCTTEKQKICPKILHAIRVRAQSTTHYHGKNGGWLREGGVKVDYYKGLQHV